VIDHVFRADLMAEAFALNIGFFAAASLAFLRLLQSARVHGSLLQTGE
jgi:ABC-2 type transport system permease protein